MKIVLVVPRWLDVSVLAPHDRADTARKLREVAAEIRVTAINRLRDSDFLREAIALGLDAKAHQFDPLPLYKTDD